MSRTIRLTVLALRIFGTAMFAEPAVAEIEEVIGLIQRSGLKNTIVDEFETWVLSHSTPLKERGVSMDFQRRETPTVAATVSLDSGSILADVSVWDIGACDIDMISRETGETVFAERYDFTSFSEIVPALEEACKKLIANS